MLSSYRLFKRFFISGEFTAYATLSSTEETDEVRSLLTGAATVISGFTSVWGDAN